MSGLSSFTPKSETINLPDGGKFAVRGLSLEDFTVLLRTHYDTLETLFDQYVTEASLAKVEADAGVEDLGISDMKGMVMEALAKAPALVGDVIARASDETENPHVARLLPVGIQIEAVQKTFRLTLEAEGGLEKLFETAQKAWTSMAGLVQGRSQ